MKKSFKKLTAVLVAAAMAVTCLPQAAIAEPLTQGEILAAGDTGTYQDFNYEELEDGTLSITKYNGSDTEVVVPSEIEGQKVTMIGYHVFSKCPDLTKVTVSDGITWISANAFEYCDSLTEVYFPKSVTTIDNSFMGCAKLTAIYVDENNEKYKDIDGVLFSKDGTRIWQFPTGRAGAYVIPDSVEEIGNWEFTECALLTEITIPDSVTKIDSNPFRQCTQLTAIHVDENNPNYTDIDGVMFTKDKKTVLKVPAGKAGAYVIPDGVTTIGAVAFDFCESITAVTIPDGVTTIESSAFEHCHSLAEINIPDSVTTIGSYAFHTCESLTEITIPKSVITIDECPFAYCGTLTAIHVDENNPNYKDIDGVLFSKDGKTIIEAPAGISGLYTIPDGVTKIGLRAFYTCDFITNVIIPDSVTAVEASAFNFCWQLKFIVVPKTVTEIGAYAFSASNNFTLMCYADSYAETYAKENNIKYVLVNLFNDKETGIEVTAGVSDNAQLNVEQTAKTDTSVSYDITFTQNGKEVKPNGGALISIPVPEGWSADTIYVYGKDDNGRFNLIDTAVSDGCILFAAYNLGQFIVSSKEADKSTLDYKYRELADGTLCIEKYLGSDAEVNVPSTVGGKAVTTIGNQAFAWNSYITKVSVPDNVTSIGDSAFSGCHSLTEIDLPDGLTTINSYAFFRCYSLTEISFPDSVTEIGQYALSDCSVLEKATLPANITSIEYSTFRDCSALTAIEIPDNVKSIKGSAFMNCSALEKADFSNSLTEIDDRAFYNCSSLTEIDLPDSLKTIGNSAFADCSSLTAAVLSDGLTTIGEYAFAWCSSLTEIDLPDSVTKIGQRAFMSSSLKNVTLPANITSIEYGTFMNCSSLTEAEIPDNVKSISEGSFLFCKALEKVTISPYVETISDNSFLRNEWTGSPNLTFYGYTNSSADTYANKFEIPFVSLGLFLDSNNGVSVTAGEGVLPDDTKLDVEQTDKTDTSVSYNITLTKDEKEIQPNGDVTVRIPVPASWNTEEVYVYHREADGKLTEIEFRISDGYVIFTANHFSEYIVSATEKKISVGDVDGDGVVNDIDVVSLARYLAGWGNEIDASAADVNGDKEINDLDTVALARQLAGWNM